MTVLPGTRRHPTTRPPRSARRFGYLVAALVNSVLLILIHGAPGWRAVGFLTADTPRILPWVTASLVAGAAVNVLYVLTDPSRLVALGSVVTTSVGLGVMGRIWEVFPFGFGSPWVLVTRILLVVGMAGGVIGLLVQIVALVRPAPGSP